MLALLFDENDRDDVELNDDGDIDMGEEKLDIFSFIFRISFYIN